MFQIDTMPLVRNLGRSIINSKINFMKIIILVLIFLTPLFANAQKSNGIAFVDGLNWAQVCQKAKAENKFIFIDVYATWCGPCKMMDKETYIDPIVGEYMNAKFISMKVQMDSTRNDPAEIKAHYKEAFALQKKYQVSAFPSFLFFSPNGELVERDLGFKKSSDFLSLAKKAANPTESFGALVLQFKNGNIEEDKLLKLAYEAKKNKEDSLALEVAQVYKKNFINGKQPQMVLSGKLLNFLAGFSPVFSFDDKIIKYLYDRPESADTALHARKGYVLNYTKYIIKRDWVYKVIQPGGVMVTSEPNWKKIEQDITSLFKNERLAKSVVLDGKISWYRSNQNWPLIVKYEIERVDMNGLDTSGMGRLGINNLVFEVIFKHGDNPKALQKGITYMETVLKIDPKDHFALDTYANILYKAGHNQQALKQEILALAIAEKEEHRDPSSIKLYKQTIQKIKDGVPTWDAK